MNPTAHKILRGAGTGLAFVIGFALVGYFTNSSPSMSQAATVNTERNSFVSSCVSSAEKDYPSISQSDVQSYCGCAEQKLEAEYGGPDQFYTPSNINNLLQNGYSQADTNAIAPCVPSDLGQ